MHSHSPYLFDRVHAKAEHEIENMFGTTVRVVLQYLFFEIAKNKYSFFNRNMAK